MAQSRKLGWGSLRRKHDMPVPWRCRGMVLHTDNTLRVGLMLACLHCMLVAVMGVDERSMVAVLARCWMRAPSGRTWARARATAS